VLIGNTMYNFEEKVEIIDGIWKGRHGLVKGCIKTGNTNTLDDFIVYVQISRMLVGIKGSKITKVEKNEPKLFLAIEQDGDEIVYRGLRAGTINEIKSMIRDDNVDIVEITEVQDHTIILQRK